MQRLNFGNYVQFMKYKTKNDIPFVKFLNFSKETENEKDEVVIAQKIIDMFFGGNAKNLEIKIASFLKALQTNGKLKMRYKLNLSVLDNAGSFIDSETFRSDQDFDNLLYLLLKPKYFWQKVDVNKISVTEGEFILANFLKGQPK